MLEEAQICPPGWRVKVYRLNEAGQWDDRGTGLARVEFGPPAAIVVDDEVVRDRQLLEAAVRLSESLYKKQGENIITLDAVADEDGGVAVCCKSVDHTKKDVYLPIVSSAAAGVAGAAKEKLNQGKRPYDADAEDEYHTVRRRKKQTKEDDSIPYDQSSSVTVALSFQDAQGCEDLWRRLSQVRNSLPKSEENPSRNKGMVLNEDDTVVDGKPSLYMGGKAWNPPSNLRIFLIHALGARGIELSARLEDEAGGGENNDHKINPEQVWHPLPLMRSVEACRAWLHCLARAITSTPNIRERYGISLAADGAALLRQMAAYFDRAEDLDDVPALLILADICKLLILLNEPPLIEALLEQPVFEAVLGILEYASDLKQEKLSSIERQLNIPQSPLTPRSFPPVDDEDDACVLQAPSPICKRNRLDSPPASADSRLPLPPNTPRSDKKNEIHSPTTATTARRVALRKMFAQQSRKIVVPFDEILLQRIEQHTRARMLRDVILRPGLDEAQLSALHSMIFWSANDILRRLDAPAHNDSTKTYLCNIVQAICEPQRCRDALCLLREMTRLARGASMTLRDAVLTNIVRSGIYGFISNVLSSTPTAELKACCVDILIATIRSDASAIRREAIAATSSGQSALDCASATTVQPPPPDWLIDKIRQRAKPIEEIIRSHNNHSEKEDYGWIGDQHTLDHIPSSLERTNTQSSQAMTEVSSSSNSMPSPLKEQTNATTTKYPVLYWLCRLADDKDEAVASAAICGIKLVLETETIPEPDRDPFLSCLYEHYMQW
eukprot:CAMPEP_0197319488 /NCGR_PEP_ID=MMETSP0891-20130614/55073_1 /TAXON_ID=44058 ORGANISM="Aureoumbra lagunensis, Strain CCMP1510" /NCGR_SAMPLE_ID=MMETSP0891 /ASSEMBLY_ACC=CAM_ASM_000534 /LENGTH=781 /DNA_ID=CAMNT_0042810441 /DNA_START=20 /DNA_END=2362 /DNA_ORIENTATION=+